MTTKGSQSVGQESSRVQPEGVALVVERESSRIGGPGLCNLLPSSLVSRRTDGRPPAAARAAARKEAERRGCKTRDVTQQSGRQTRAGEGSSWPGSCLPRAGRRRFSRQESARASPWRAPRQWEPGEGDQHVSLSLSLKKRTTPSLFSAASTGTTGATRTCRRPCPRTRSRGPP